MENPSALSKRFFAFARRVHPHLDRMEREQQLQFTVMTATILYLFPLTIISVLWLISRTQLSQVTDQPTLFILLVVIILFVDTQQFRVYLNLGENERLSITASLDSLFDWTALLIFGPTALWIFVTLTIVESLNSARRVYHAQENAFWVAFFHICQSGGGILFPYLLSFALYEALGGSVPLESFVFSDWLIALVAITANAVLPAIFLLPLPMLMAILHGKPMRAPELLYFAVMIPSLLLLINPFGIPLALAYTRNSAELFAFFAIGGLLVSVLAHNLSQTAESNQQRARELSRLEKLGQAIIQAPADASTLPSLLHKHVRLMFSEDRVEIKLFDHLTDSPVRLWSSFHLLIPDRGNIADDNVWEQLRQLPENHFFLHNVTFSPQGPSKGNAAVVKITLAGVSQSGAPASCVGGIYLVRSKQVGKVDSSLAALQSLAAHIGSALYRAETYTAALKHEKVEQELALAGQIQSSFLPKAIPAIDGWQFAATLDPARQTSGDFFDFIQLEEDLIGLVVADVADKGTGAALYMALSRTLLRTYAMQYPTAPAKALEAANDRILADTESNLFVTVFYGVLHVREGRLVYANAGHNPPYHFRPTNATPAALVKTGIPLGIFGNRQWKEQTASLGSGDVLAVYSDGLSDAQNTNAEPFTEKRLIETVHSHLHHTAEEIQTALLQEVQGFTGSAPQFDDITLLIVRRLP